MDRGDSVKNVEFSSRDRFKRIHPNPVEATDSMLTWIATFCNPNAVYRAHLGVHMAYKVDPFHSACQFSHLGFLFYVHEVGFLYYVDEVDPRKYPSIVAAKSTKTGRLRNGYLY